MQDGSYTKQIVDVYLHEASLAPSHESGILVFARFMSVDIRMALASLSISDNLIISELCIFK